MIEWCHLGIPAPRRSSVIKLYCCTAHSFPVCLVLGMLYGGSFAVQPKQGEGRGLRILRHGSGAKKMPLVAMVNQSSMLIFDRDSYFFLTTRLTEQPYIYHFFLHAVII